MKHLLTLISFALLSAAAVAQPMPVVAPKDDSPIVRLPVEKPVNVAKFDPAAVKARDLPYHVTLTKAPEAWAKNPAAKGAGLKVAVIDTYGQHDHPGFNGKVKGVYSAISKRLNPPMPAKMHPHCTHAAGIVHSIAPDADLYFVEVLDGSGSGSTADIAHGIDYAVTEFKVDVISLSLGGPDADPYMPAAIKRAADAGVIVVAAAGNDGGGPGRDTEGYPARYDGATSVAACDSKRQLAAFSSWGPTVFTCKPGVNVTSLLPKDGSGEYQEGDMSGTSMSTPDEAGCAVSWAGSNGVPKDKERWKKYRAAVLAASPFAERNNARGYGMYTLDKITGEASTPPPPVKPTPGEKVYVLDLVKLKADGYTSVRIDLGPAAGTAGQPIPVASFPPQLAPQFQPAPVFTGPGAVYQGHYPPPVIYQQMPSTCGPGGCSGGQCQPQPLLFPRLRGW